MAPDQGREDQTHGPDLPLRQGGCEMASFVRRRSAEGLEDHRVGGAFEGARNRDEGDYTREGNRALQTPDNGRPGQYSRLPYPVGEGLGLCLPRFGEYRVRSTPRCFGGSLEALGLPRRQLQRGRGRAPPFALVPPGGSRHNRCRPARHGTLRGRVRASPRTSQGPNGLRIRQGFGEPPVGRNRGFSAGYRARAPSRREESMTPEIDSVTTGRGREQPTNAELLGAARRRTREEIRYWEDPEIFDPDRF